MILTQFFKALSYIFHPLFMPILGIYLLFSNETTPVSYLTLDALYYFPYGVKFYLYILMTVLTVVAPLISILILKKNNMISSIQIENQQERTYPLVLILFYYAMVYFYVAYQFPVEYKHPALMGFLFGNFISLFIALIINLYYKISLHAIGIFGLVGMLIAYSQTQLNAMNQDGITNLFLIVYLIIVASLVNSARLYLKSHTLSEVLSGMVLGFFIVYSTVKYGLYI